MKIIKDHVEGQEDHPRIRGTNNTRLHWLRIGLGSSPHTRDKYFYTDEVDDSIRIIPAYAGQITWKRRISNGNVDHPRIRGTNGDKPMTTLPMLGSSPHTRDKWHSPINNANFTGIIPAYAGQM